MSFRYLILVLIAIIGLGFFACEPENFDEIIEEVLPTDTTKVVSDKGTLQYLLQGVQNSYNNGFARLIADDLLFGVRQMALILRQLNKIQDLS